MKRPPRPEPRQRVVITSKIEEGAGFRSAPIGTPPLNEKRLFVEDATVFHRGGPVRRLSAIEAIREGLIRYFVEEDSADRQRVRDLRRRIADRIEADLALLDALDGDPDREVENEHGGDVQDEPHDPEEDADHWEVGSIGLVAFDGINYGRVRL